MMDLCPLFRGQQHRRNKRFSRSQSKSHTRGEEHETGIFVYVYFAHP
jgi:hypothetical protein